MSLTMHSFALNAKLKCKNKWFAILGHPPWIVLSWYYELHNARTKEINTVLPFRSAIISHLYLFLKSFVHSLKFVYIRIPVMIIIKKN